jgi:bidirectional [NiFe] hydrogenase diaphorase subunit
LQHLAATMKRHQYQPDALIEVLHTAQELFGYLDPELLVFVANGLKFPRVGCMVSRLSITSSP